MEFVCKYFGKICKNKLSKSTHENFCKNNPNRRDMSGKNNPRYGKEPPNKIKKTAKYRCRNNDIIQETIEEIENYKACHKCCEICGSTKKLCVDHNHKTLRFRGMLRQSCNRFLGWFERNREKMYQNSEEVEKLEPIYDKVEETGMNPVSVKFLKAYSI